MNDFEHHRERILSLKDHGTREELVALLEELAATLSGVTQVIPDINGALIFGLIAARQKPNVSMETTVAPI